MNTAAQTQNATTYNLLIDETLDELIAIECQLLFGNLTKNEFRTRIRTIPKLWRRVRSYERELHSIERIARPIFNQNHS